MKRIKKALAALAEKLGANKAKLKYAYTKWKHHNRKAGKLHDRAGKAAANADLARKNERPARARKRGRQGIRLQAAADKHRAKAQYWVGLIKEAKRKIHHLEQSQAEKESELAAWRHAHKLTFRENTVTGGTRKARFRAACLKSAANCSAGKRRNFYSQPGSWSVDRCFTGEPYGYRSDCSQWLTSVCVAADLPDPNGTNFGWGYTGTLVGQHNGWKQVSEAEMKKAGFGYVVYGSGTGHHVEAYVGPGEKTVGHGSAPIDAGVIDLFGDGSYRCFTLR